MLNNKGFTVIELIVSFALTMLVAVLLFQMLISLKSVYVNSGLKGQLLSKQAIISSKINGDLENKKIKIALKCGPNCLNFFFEDDTNTKLIADTKNGLLTYGEYTTKLIDGSSFGDIDVSNETILSVGTGLNNSIIKINLPIYHKSLEDNYGINIIYQYDNRVSAISDIVFNDDDTTQEGIILIGSKEMNKLSSQAYVELGHYTFRTDGTIALNDAHVTRTGTVGSTVGQTYTLTYTLRNDGGTILDVATREITIIESNFNFAYTGAVQTFTALYDGIYKFELWGSAGAYWVSNNAPGRGAYTTGAVYLAKDDVIYIYVGSRQSPFNGGAVGGRTDLTEAGGGATDIRLIGGAWNDVSGLRSRIMVAGAGGGTGETVSRGGDAGGLVGFAGNNVAFNGAGASQTTGGLGSVNGTMSGSNGSFGAGGNGGLEVCCAYGGAGGSGYYGGGGGAGVAGSDGAGGGGSSFISGYLGADAVDETGTHTGQSVHYSGIVFTSAVMYAGNEAMPSYAGGYVTGNSGNGYARVTMLSSMETSPSALTSAEVLVVAGGGGGATTGSGGGAGGMVTDTISLSSQSYSVTVGAGGAGGIQGTTDMYGKTGGNSIISTITAYGGGGGVSHGATIGQSGGSGSGGTVVTGGTSVGANGTTGQGNAGGAGFVQASWQAISGGGGGAGAVGNTGGTAAPAGNGGNGLASSISGTSIYYAGGGAGGDVNIALGAVGGLGGGGNSTADAAGSNGTPNTGSGGGGGGYTGTYWAGGSGGSGIVIIRYAGVQKATGGTITSVNGYTIHTFTSSGTFQVW